MAGIFSDEINNRGDFFKQLASTRQVIGRLLARLPFEDTLQSVALQLEAIERWTANGRSPARQEGASLDMALRMFREYEMTDDVEIQELRGKVSGIHSYVEHWPDDATAADPDNDQYL